MLFRSELVVLSSFHSPGLSPVNPWALVPENPTWPHSLEMALFLFGSGGGVQGCVTLPHTRGDALGVHISELLANLQRGALP